eukprot:4508461-Pyramimonas_sp.AAC.1
MDCAALMPRNGEKPETQRVAKVAMLARLFALRPKLDGLRQAERDGVTRAVHQARSRWVLRALLPRSNHICLIDCKLHFSRRAEPVAPATGRQLARILVPVRPFVRSDMPLFIRESLSLYTLIHTGVSSAPLSFLAQEDPWQQKVRPYLAAVAAGDLRGGVTDAAAASEALLKG